jgi:integrase
VDWAERVEAMYQRKRGEVWWAFHDVPPSLREAMGLTRFAASLKTKDKATADSRAKLLWLHDWSKQIADAKRRKGAGVPDKDETEFYRSLIRNARTDDERNLLKQHVHDIARDRAERAAERAGVMDYHNPEFEEVAGVVEARRFAALATGAVVPTTEHVDEWIATINDRPKTKDMKRADVVRFAADFPYLSSIDRKAVQKWLVKKATEDKLTYKTLERILSFLRSYWRYLVNIEAVDEERRPFSDLTIPKVNVGTSYKPFTPSEVVRLLAAAEERGDSQLADLIRLAMWSGARIEELCALKVDRVTADSFTVDDSKTEAGVREVPIHPKLAPTLKRLVASSIDGYVLSGLGKNKYDDRSDAIGKRFGRMKAELKFGKALVFHSIRKTVVTQLENAGIGENTAADIVGHEKPRITYGLYSGGATLDVKREALEKLAYPIKD